MQPPPRASERQSPPTTTHSTTSPSATAMADFQVPSNDTPASQTCKSTATSIKRTDLVIGALVQNVLPAIPHLLSVPTKTPFLTHFPYENRGTPFQDWEVSQLQYMTLVSTGNRGVADTRGGWENEITAASPYSQGARSGTVTPYSERDPNRPRAKMSFADYKAGKRPPPLAKRPPVPDVPGQNGKPKKVEDTMKINPTQKELFHGREPHINPLPKKPVHPSIPAAPTSAPKTQKTGISKDQLSSANGSQSTQSSLQSTAKSSASQTSKVDTPRSSQKASTAQKPPAESLHPKKSLQTTKPSISQYTPSSSQKLESGRLNKKETSKTSHEADTKRRPQPPADMPPLLSPLPITLYSPPPPTSPIPMPPLLSPTLPPVIERALARSKANTVEARHERSRNPETPGVARKTKPADSSKERQHDSKSSAPRGPLLVKLKYKKRRAQDIRRILQLKPHPSKGLQPPGEARPITSTKSPAAQNSPSMASKAPAIQRSVSTSGKSPAVQSSASTSTKPPAVQNSVSTSKKSPAVEGGVSMPTKTPAKASTVQETTPSTLKNEEKKRPRPTDESSEPDPKRAKGPAHLDISKSRTLLGPPFKSPAPFGAPVTPNTHINTPKKGDAMKSVQMRKVNSSDEHAHTPQAMPVSTPASAEKPHRNGSDQRTTEIDNVRMENSKYTNLGTTLKRQMDQILKSKEGPKVQATDDEKRLAAVVGMESLISYVSGFHANDVQRRLERKVNAGDLWGQFLALQPFVKNITAAYPELAVLAILLGGISLDELDKILLERLSTESSSSPDFTKLRDEYVKHGRNRHVVWKDYRDTCKRFTRDFPKDRHSPLLSGGSGMTITEVKKLVSNVLVDFTKKHKVAWDKKIDF